MRIEEPMPEPTPAVQQHILPPLILHPFTDAAGSLRALEDAKSAARQLHLDGGALSRAEQLRMRLLEAATPSFACCFLWGKMFFDGCGSAGTMRSAQNPCAAGGWRNRALPSF